MSLLFYIDKRGLDFLFSSAFGTRKVFRALSTCRNIWARTFAT